jgi:lipopolysaccharide heptosyltransferase II
MLKPAKRILIFNVNWVGDVLFSTAAIRNIRRNFPKSFIACIVPSRCYQVLKGNPHLDEVIIYDEKDRHSAFLEKLKFIQMLKAKQFDTVFLLHRSFSRALLCRLSGIPCRIGYYTKKRGFLLEQKIIPPDRDKMHRIDYYLNIIEKAGLKVEDRFTDFFTSDEDDKAVAEFLRDNAVAEGDFLVGLNPGGNWPAKRWPKEYWVDLADKLISHLRAKVIITGSTQDAALAREIEQLMKEKPILATGVFNLKQLGALCKKLGLFISADSGPLHIANAVGGKKIIALFGPTSAQVTGPYPLKNVFVIQKAIGCKIPCYVKNCPDNRCMKAITPDEVIAEIKKIEK